jgi:hypothetical protein
MGVLDKQKVPISISAGIDTKTDPKQVQGKLLLLQNGIFQTGMEIKKRNGYIALPSLGAGVMLSPYNNELVVLDGNALYSYSAATASNINKGTLITTSLSVTNIVRNTYVQQNQDSAINSGLQCFVWNDSSGGVRYSVIDSTTGQSIVANNLVAANATITKVLSLGTYFVILYRYQNTLYYQTISTASPTSISTATTIATDCSDAVSTFDAEIINGTLYLAYPSTTSDRISMFSLSSSLVLSSKYNVSSTINAVCISVFGDSSNNVWVAYASANAVYVYVANSALTSLVLAVTEVEAPSNNVRNITGIVSGTTATLYYELTQATFVSNTLTPQIIRKNTVTLAGVVGTASQFIVGFGLAAKVFAYNSVNYLLLASNSTLQASYFLVNGSGVAVAKFSPGNGGGLTDFNILPEMNLVSAGNYQVAALYKDDLVSVGGNLFTGTGVTSAKITFTSQAPSKFVLGQNLHICGGILNMYDGANVVEHNFNFYPEGLTATIGSGGAIGIGASTASINQRQYCAIYQWTDNQGQQHQSAPSIPVTAQFGGPPIQSSGTFTRASNQITAVANADQMSVGQYFIVPGIWSDSGLNPTITAISGNTITMSATFPSGSGAPATGTYNFLVASNEFMNFGGDVVSGSNVITVYPTAVAAFNNVKVGQTILWAGAYASDFSPAGSPFPEGSYITAVTPPTDSTNGSITVSNPATFSTSFSSGVNDSLYLSFDTQSVALEVPYLHLTGKTNVTLNIYATQMNETTFYQVTSPSSPQYNVVGSNYLSFTDETPDGILIGNQQLYTNGGVVENNAAPAFIASTTFKSRAVGILAEDQLSWWYSQQTIPGTPVSFSEEFFENLDSRIGQAFCVAAMDDKLVFFGNGALPIFYVVGTGPSPNGTNDDFTDAIPIPSVVGCTNQASIVVTDWGIMFQSPSKGIYLLDRSLNVSYIGADVEAFNGVPVTSAQLMDNETQVRFTLNNGTELVYDNYYKQWDVFTDLSANDSGIFQQLHTFINPSGAIWQESPGTFTDNGSAILMHLKSNWMSFANIQGFQRVYSFLLFGEYKSPHTLTINIYTDFNFSTPMQTVTIPVLSNPSPLPYQFRVFMDEYTMKCEAIQIEIIESQPSGSYGEGFSLSNMAFIVGVKKGLQKVTAAQSFG